MYYTCAIQYIYVYIYIQYTHIYTVHVICVVVFTGQKRADIKSLAAEVTSNCELPNVGSGNKTTL